MPLLIDRDVLIKNLDEVSPAFDEFRRVLNDVPSAEEYSNMISLALGGKSSNELSGEIFLSDDAHTSISDYITTTTTAVPADLTSGGYITIPSSTYTVTSIGVTKERTIDDIVEEKIEQYKELMRLQALGCKNCGGSIDKDTMTCEYCGTRYRN